TAEVFARARDGAPPEGGQGCGDRAASRERRAESGDRRGSQLLRGKTRGAGSAAPLTAPRNARSRRARHHRRAVPSRPRAALVRTGVEDRKDPPRRGTTVTHGRYTPLMRRTTVLVWMGIGLCSVVMLAESAGGLQWTTPEGWKNQGALPMRVATYAVAPSAGDKTGGECAVFYFGSGQGGSIDANLERWKGQFQGPGGKPAAAQIAKRSLHGLSMTTIDTSGEYSGMSGPMAGSSQVAPGYRLLGAIVEGPRGNVF